MKHNRRFNVLRAVSLFFYGILIIGCSNSSNIAPLADYEIVEKWAEMTLYITQYTPANTPTYASRCVGYIGLTMYESVVPGYSEYNSLVGQLNGLDKLPIANPNEKYNWQLSFNAGQAAILRNIYNQTSDENKVKIDSLEKLIFEDISSSIEDKKLIDRSVAFGRSVANSIFEWSKKDGGHRGYLKNFDKTLVFPERPGGWKPPLYAQSFSHYPLHPHWGENRTFLKVDSEIETPYMIPYDTAKTSPYYKQYLAVYEKEKLLTQAEKECAIWWGDDPDVTFTPPGHSFYIATQVIKDKKPDLIHCAETYAHVGLAVADAFINCWKWKYHFFSERPNYYITEHIDERWESFWPDPPFPAFPSGHAIQAAAAAKVLMNLYGENFTFTDRSHEGRERDEIRSADFKPRSFTTFWAVAEETANSRFYGGIHTPQDNNVGLEEGARIAENINHLKWKK
ncbi:MAG: phosphatase PAP2 family protein [Bacteroidetes bacterium]|nr:phosphatase PAP2 family protein [Bacteroidota bacterium]